MDQPKPSTSEQPAAEQSRLGRVCRTCFDFREYAKARFQAMSSGQNQEQGAESQSSSGPSQPAEVKKPAHECPLGIRGLGRSSWNYLHTLATYYGYDHGEGTFDNPVPPKQQETMRRFIKDFAQFYPCGHCRFLNPSELAIPKFHKDGFYAAIGGCQITELHCYLSIKEPDEFIAYVDANPPAVQDSPSLSKWMCNLHNSVNRGLGYPEFDCAKVNERWRDGPGDGSCDGLDGGL